MSYRRGRTRNYGELSQAGSTNNRGSDERSLSPDHRLAPSNPVRFRSQTVRPRTPTAASSNSHSVPGVGSTFALESRTVSASSTRSAASSTTLTLPPSPTFPPNLATARLRIVSNSSVHSLASVEAVESYLVGPMVYRQGFSPLETCLPVYPVISQVLRYLSSRDLFSLYAVSKTFEAYLSSNYSSHWSELVLCKERHWISCVYRPQTARERVELETVYRHVRQYVYWKIGEEQQVLKEVRDKYDQEVAFILDRELNLGSKFVSGGLRRMLDIKNQKERILRRSIVGGSKVSFEPGEIAYRKEITLPRLFFNKRVQANHITRAMVFAATQLQRAINTQNMNPLQFVKTLVIDGSNIDMPSLAAALDLSQVNGQGRLEALSACACSNLNLVRWARYLETNPRALGHLKSLRIYPSEHFPIAPFHYDATKSLVRLYRRGNLPHDPHNPPQFPAILTLEEHLNITMPLITSNSPNDLINTPGLEPQKLRANNLVASRFSLCDAHENQRRMYGRWMGGPYITHLHPALKIMALCQARGIQLNFNLCASGSKCYGWKLVTDRRAVGKVAADEDQGFTMHATNTDPNNIGTHVIGSRIRGEKSGTKECACCGGWEWATSNQARNPGWLIKALGLSAAENWVIEENGCISLLEPLNPGVKVSFRMIFGPDIPFQTTGDNIYDQEEHRCKELMKDVGGVKIPVLLKRTEIWAMDNFGNLAALMNVCHEWYPYPAGCGAGGICGDCEKNLTCWGCGKFYCQICTFAPNVRRATMCDLSIHLKVFCPDRKHGPLCSDCSPKFNTTCGGCLGVYCNICYPGGIKLQKKWNRNDLHTLSNFGADDIWEEWDGTDQYGREINAIGRDEDRPPSEPEEWDVGASTQEIEAANESENAQLLVVQGEAGQVVTTVGDVVSQLQEMRVRIGDGRALDLSAEYVSLNQHADGHEHDDVMDFDSDTDQSLKEEGTSDGEVVHEMARQAAGLVPDVSGHPTLIPYTAEVPCFPTVQAHELARIPLQNPPKDLDFDLKDHEPVQIFTSCDFCPTAYCAVCTHGKDKLKPRWKYVHCGGCGGIMCPKCCHQECSVCQRSICQKCDKRERNLLSPTALELFFPYVLNLHETKADGKEVYSCLRCLLRKAVGLTKAAVKAANPNGPPVDGYGRVIDTNGLVDPDPGLQMLREQLRREFDPGNTEALVGVMDGMPGSMNELLGSLDGSGTRLGLGLLPQEVSTELERGTAAAMTSSHWQSGQNAEDDDWIQGEEEGVEEGVEEGCADNMEEEYEEDEEDFSIL
ncbi:hypothetical protein L211DRAFT_867586 [Terfezia boudieri ATCC MYA-4762]|uniref:F-box domain-containing protein n=1 Tax=Terfezia boudieri ATCC MYA-4762 TaxID=1051890 RepID=A0A3N4LPD0_9PEZI|nr:hypothetical protein L211DRAFT_867586 [Terfezia boudieri ATCC MYA-4762]